MDHTKLKAGTDQAWPEAVSLRLGLDGAGMADVLWRCEASVGGRVYASGLFTSEAEAAHFMQQMQQQEPDQSFNVEKIKASAVWN